MQQGTKQDERCGKKKAGRENVHKELQSGKKAERRGTRVGERRHYILGQLGDFNEPSLRAEPHTTKNKRKRK